MQFQVRKFQMSELTPGENIREVTPELVDKMMKDLVIQGKITPISSFIVLPANENGLHPIHDGNTRYQALLKLGYADEVNCVEISEEQAQDEEFLFELQTALGTSNNRLTEIETALGVVKWILSNAKKLTQGEKPLTVAKAQAQAIKNATKVSSFKNTDGEPISEATVRNYVKFFELEDLLKQNTKRGVINSIFDALTMDRVYRKLVKDFSPAGYSDTLEQFFNDCLNLNRERKNGAITKLDIDRAGEAVETKYKTAQLKTEVGNEAIAEALEKGTITHEGVENLKAKAEELGLSVEEAYQMAVESAEDLTEEGETIVLTDESLSLGLAEAAKNKVSKVSKLDLSELTDEEMEADIFGNAVNLLLTIGGDADDLIRAIKAELKKYEGMTVSDYPREAKERLYRAAKAVDITITKVEKKIASDRKKTEREAKKALEAEEKAKQLAESLASLENLDSEPDLSLIVDDLPEDEDSEMDTSEIVVEADEDPTAFDPTDENDALAGLVENL